MVICVGVSYLGLAVQGYREKERYSALLRCAGFGLLLLSCLQGGSHRYPFAVGFGVLFLRSAFRVYEGFAAGSA